MRLKVFSGKTFAECEAPFNQWMAEHSRTKVVNFSFNNSETVREIAVIYLEEAQVAAVHVIPTGTA